jgi:hypothetical protein
MDIYPQDLHTELYERIVYSRRAGTAQADAADAADFHRAWNTEQGRTAADADERWSLARLFRSQVARRRATTDSARYMRALHGRMEARNLRWYYLAPFLTWLFFPLLCLVTGEASLWFTHITIWALIGMPVAIRLATIPFEPYTFLDRVAAWHRPRKNKP